MIKVQIYPHLQHLTDNQDVVKVSGSTVGECLEDLVKQFPGIRKGLFDKHGKLLSYVEVYVNGESKYSQPEQLDSPVKDGDEVSLVLIVGGG
mgnify:CR=1 FL=1